MVPLMAGEKTIGLIGIGSEFTGGRYGHDDYDLLTALSTQAASALLAVRMAERLAHARERKAWDKLSAFVLHDVKNAATGGRRVFLMASWIRCPPFLIEFGRSFRLRCLDQSGGRSAKLRLRSDFNATNAQLVRFRQAANGRAG